MPDPIPEHRKLYPHGKKPKRVPSLDEIIEREKTHHRFAYMLSPQTVAELKSRGIEFVCANTGAVADDDALRYCPAFRLPGGKLILVLKDNEANGPGALMEAES